jgi:hypothetical protein
MAMIKVGFFNGRVINYFTGIVSVISASLSLAVLFVDIPKDFKLPLGYIFLSALFFIYLGTPEKQQTPKHAATGI